MESVMNDTSVVSATIEAAKALAVVSVSGRQQAADLWDAIRAFRKQAEAQKEEVCRPLKSAWDQSKVPFDTFVKECQGHEATLQRKMSDWDREQEQFARKVQAEIQAKIDAVNAKRIAKAEAKGIEPVLRVAPIVEGPAKSIETQAGTTQNRSSRTCFGIKNAVDNEDIRSNDPRIKDIMSLAPHLCIFDWVAFRKMASTGFFDGHEQVTQRNEFIYTQRAGHGDHH